MAIKSFRDKTTAAIFLGLPARAIPVPLRKRVLMKLQQLHSAGALDDLRIPPSNRLEALKGSRAGQHSIRINDQWRVCFNVKQREAFPCPPLPRAGEGRGEGNGHGEWPFHHSGRRFAMTVRWTGSDAEAVEVVDYH